MVKPRVWSVCGVTLRPRVFASPVSPAACAPRPRGTVSVSSDPAGTRDFHPNIIYLGFEKSQHSVTHDSLRYINILTYLLTYLPPNPWGPTGPLFLLPRCSALDYQALNRRRRLMHSWFIAVVVTVACHLVHSCSILTM